jgi:RNAse (barnase) inhibitor barstar
MVASNIFSFVPDVRAFVRSDALVARVAGDIHTSQQLFDLLYRVLSLPGYFGFNWNALFDCLRDFHWVNERVVLIVHDDVPVLAPSEMKIYLEVLRDAVVDWKPGEAHALQVVFDEKERARIQDALAVA